jgi:phage terminase Nu1 subunit (DNA packaging protein)
MARKSKRKKSELKPALDQISDESDAAAVKEFQDLLAQAKSNSTDLIRQNATELEERLVLLRKRMIDKEDFDFFVESQKRDLRVFIDSLPAQAQERAEKLTLNLLDLAGKPLAMALLEGDSHTPPPRD